MSYLAEQILRRIKQHGLNQKLVAEKVGLTQPHLSGILRGRQQSVDPKVVAKIANAASENMADRAEVMYAYLRDCLFQMKGEAANDAWVRIRLSANGEGVDEKSGLYEMLSKLCPNVAKAIRRLVHVASRDQVAGDILLNLAPVVVRGRTDSLTGNT